MNMVKISKDTVMRNNLLGAMRYAFEHPNSEVIYFDVLEEEKLGPFVLFGGKALGFTNNDELKEAISAAGSEFNYYPIEPGLSGSDIFTMFKEIYDFGHVARKLTIVIRAEKLYDEFLAAAFGPKVDVQWNSSPTPVNGYECKDHPAVLGTNYMEVSDCLGTSGCSRDSTMWTWSVMGVIKDARGVQFVMPGDWVIPFVHQDTVEQVHDNGRWVYTPNKARYLVLTDEDYKIMHIKEGVVKRSLSEYERKKLLDAKLCRGEGRFWNSNTETFNEYLAVMGIPEFHEK